MIIYNLLIAVFAPFAVSISLYNWLSKKPTKNTILVAPIIFLVPNLICNIILLVVLGYATFSFDSTGSLFVLKYCILNTVLSVGFALLILFIGLRLEVSVGVEK